MGSLRNRLRPECRDGARLAAVGRLPTSPGEGAQWRSPEPTGADRSSMRRDALPWRSSRSMCGGIIARRRFDQRLWQPL
jgi:hypothetical protein